MQGPPAPPNGGFRPTPSAVTPPGPPVARAPYAAPYMPPPHLGYADAPFGPPKATDGKAIASIALAAASVVTCMGAIAGIPAIILGAVALRDINKPDATTSGKGLAISGIAIGSLSSLFTLGWLGMMFFSISKGPFGGITPPVVPPALTAPAAVHEYVGSAEVHRAEGANLATILSDESVSAVAQGRTLIVQTTGTTSCPRACAEIRRALVGPELQRLFSERAILLEVSIDRYGADLAKLDVPTFAAPMFFLVDSSGKVTDLISADEWDDNDDENVAPVLEAFMDHTLTNRKVANPRSPLPSATSSNGAKKAPIFEDEDDDRFDYEEPTPQKKKKTKL